MELYQLRSFLAVAEFGNLTRAAERLFASQPSVSAHIKALEEECGVRLFERLPGGMRLTVEGARLQEHAERILEAAATFRSTAEGLRDAVTGELAIAMNNHPKVLRMHEVLGRLARDHADLTFDLVYAASGAVLAGILDGEVDAGFFEGTCEDPKIRSHRLTDVELCIAGPLEWAEDFERPDWSRLAARPWVFVTPLCYYHHVMQTLCAEKGFTLEKRFGIDDEVTALELAADGLALTLTAVHSLDGHPRRDRLAVVPWFRTSVPLSLGYLASRANEPIVRAFREAVLGVWEIR